MATYIYQPAYYVDFKTRYWKPERHVRRWRGRTFIFSARPDRVTLKPEGK